MDSQGGKLLTLEMAGDIIGGALGAREDEDFTGASIGMGEDSTDVAEEQGTLVGFGANLDDLSNAVVSGNVQGPDVHLDKVVEVVVG